ncbi:hypothetical protein [Treponema sp.]|uniref:hypothetical protein n=1 Tax=Treponema sp. TaxID=166 RepID=UPI001DE02089|nr:hypothetical protein [Treponema sp.]MBS7240889.1 hypothetical protein [Treponema sp.]MBS7261023.1 hypothetical protein [Treponema sp.]MDY4133386.1 hypothetical protein [Treponema sp.]
MSKKDHTSIISFLAISILFCMVSAGCSKFSPEIIFGQWYGECQFKSDVNFSGKKPEDPEASLFYKQEVTYIFNKEGIFYKDITQKFVKTVALDENAIIPSDEQLNLMLNKKITVSGTYTITKDKITFINKTVKTEDGNNISFEEYRYTNPTAGEETVTENYTFVENTLNLSEINFNKKM